MESDKEAINKYAPETLMMGFGYNPWWSEGSVKPPLFLTSTFLFRNAEEGEEYFKIAYGLKKQGEKPLGLIYSRINNPELEILEDRLKVLEKAENAAAFSMGMAAISTAIFSLCRPGDQIVYNIPVYGGTDYLFEHILPEFKIECIAVEGGENFCDQVRALKQHLNRLRLIFVETPANPTIMMTDVAETAKLRDECSKDREVLLIVDNTFLGPVFQRVVPLGADLAVYSATKFLGGHSDLLAGAIMGKTELVNSIKNYRTIMGSASTPFVCWLLMRSLETLKLRMENQAKNATVIAHWLKEQPQVMRVLYPDLLEPGSLQYQIYKKQSQGPGSIIAFDVKGGKQCAFNILNAVKLCKLAVSLGGTETLIEHPQTMTHADVSPQVQQRAGITEGLIRLSVGIENANDIISDLSSAMQLIG